MAEALEAVKRQYEVVHKGNIEALVDLFTDDCQLIAMGARVQGQAQLRGFTTSMLNAFPDLNHEIVQVVEAENTVVAIVEITGTHTGTLRSPSGDLAPTGRRFRVPAAQIFQVDEGRIRSMHSYADRLDLLQQLGVIPAPAQVS